ncbi:carboxymuconolactone decarboxylase family protein [Roseovarius sp.]|uniref:carboxymuconolactone decarboxylase family protein n=1 Tax=Roseovarius sp. TaxID=1486281 RepID=UPI003A9825CF
MSDLHLPKPTKDLVEQRHALAPEIEDAFRAFSKAVFAEGALDARSKQLIAVAVAHVTQCPWCIEGHVKAALRAGASDEQVMEAIWVAAEMRAGAAWAHALKAVETIGDTKKRDS